MYSPAFITALALAFAGYAAGYAVPDANPPHPPPPGPLPRPPSPKPDAVPGRRHKRSVDSHAGRLDRISLLARSLSAEVHEFQKREAEAEPEYDDDPYTAFMARDVEEDNWLYF